MAADLVVNYEHLRSLERIMRQANNLVAESWQDFSGDLARCGSAAVDQESRDVDGSEKKLVTSAEAEIETLRLTVESARMELQAKDARLAQLAAMS